MQNIVNQIIQWHKDRNLIEGSTDKDQVLKLAQELGELSDNVCKNNHPMLIADDLGDMMVVMLNIMYRNELTIDVCLQKAYNSIKDRKGKKIKAEKILKIFITFDPYNFPEYIPDLYLQTLKQK